MIFQRRSLVLDGCPMFAQAYMGRKRILPMLSLHGQGLVLLAAVFSPHRKSVGGATPRLFQPMFPDFLHVAPPTDACAAFIKESRMKFVNARDLDRKSGCTLGRTLRGTRPGRWAKSFCAVPPGLDPLVMLTRHFRAGLLIVPSLRDWVCCFDKLLAHSPELELLS